MCSWSARAASAPAWAMAFTLNGWRAFCSSSARCAGASHSRPAMRPDRGSWKTSAARRRCGLPAHSAACPADVGKLDVGLVEHRDHMLRQPVHEAVDRLLVHHRAGRVVRVGDEHEARVFGDRVRHRVQVVDESGIRDLHIFRAEKRGHEFVNDEGVLGGDQLGLAVEEGVAEQLDDFVGAVAEHHVPAVEPRDSAIAVRRR
jgi:hypothetical protein